ncbi:MAG TPA: kelch repeat-containing protein, partial [Acidimicrobiia bacterium]|nr:kelch repeat-containing protein [Acidimicrobiia bacterium]
VQRFDSRSGVAVVVSHLPTPRADSAAVVIGRTAYIVGGYDGHSWRTDVLATRDGVRFRVVAQLPIGVRYPALAVYGPWINVFGGETPSGAITDVQRINVETGTTKVVAQLPQPRAHANAVVLDGAIDVAGGGSTSILRFDPIACTFRTVGTMPVDVHDAGAATVRTTALVLGGENPDRSPAIYALR